jgi:alcohol dehydrogenase class IV
MSYANTFKHITIGTQDIFSGTPCLPPFVEKLQTWSKRPLIVTDAGVAHLTSSFITACEAANLKPAVAPHTSPNPTISDVIALANAFTTMSCDSIVGFGGGGPMDAAKAAAGLVAAKYSKPGFDFKQDGNQFLENIRPFMSSQGPDSAWVKAVPPIAAIPTTAGTGSEGGKSAVITNSKGIKCVFGHSSFMPRAVALAPQLTAKLPAGLTAATGLDALFHCIEAFFVTKKEAYNDGMDDAGIVVTDDYAVKGVRLILQNLKQVFQTGSDLDSRLHMQFAALYGAKAFRKGSLGGIHATAHSIGAHYHLHHGTAVARMSIPVMEYTQTFDDEETKAAYEKVRQLFVEHGYEGKTCSSAVQKFLSEFDIPVGLDKLPVAPGDIDLLAKMAANDPCQTNPIPLHEQDYHKIFSRQAKK